MNAYYLTELFAHGELEILADRVRVVDKSVCRQLKATGELYPDSQAMRPVSHGSLIDITSTGRKRTSFMASGFGAGSVHVMVGFPPESN